MKLLAFQWRTEPVTDGWQVQSGAHYQVQSGIQWNTIFALLTGLLRAAKPFVKRHLVDLRGFITHLACLVGNICYFNLAQGIAQPYTNFSFDMAQLH